jgi:hypothetical protein
MDWDVGFQISLHRYKVASISTCIDMQTALAALLATNVIDHATDSLNLVDPGQEQVWVGSVFA